jgi:hypothetical protein
MSKKGQFSAASLTRQVTGFDKVLSEAKESELPVNVIGPDPAQPRRAMPADLRAAWVAAAAPTDVLFKQWAELALEQHPHVLGWEQVINPPNDQRPADDDEFMDGPNMTRTPIAALWMKLVHLAADIHAAGLQQRIVVYKVGPKDYRLLIGERRLLAYLLLNWQGYGGYTNIPSLVVDGYDPVAQAIENGSREDLNAIERARQLAILLLHFNGVTPPTDPDWDWYAQAADAKQYRVPRGKADLVMRACGFTGKQEIMRYRKLLTLPTELSNLADQYSLAEGKLRGPLAEGMKGSQLATYVRQACGLEQADPPPPPSPVTLADKAYGAVQRVTQLDSDAIRQMPPQQRERLRTLLETLIERTVDVFDHERCLLSGLAGVPKDVRTPVDRTGQHGPKGAQLEQTATDRPPRTILPA